MIEKFSDQELKQLIAELKEVGFEVKDNAKSYVVRQVAKEVFGGTPFICDEIRKGIFLITDFCTDNYERDKAGRNCSCKIVPESKSEEYREIIRGIFEAIKPHYGMIGFRDKKGYLNE